MLERFVIVVLPGQALQIATRRFIFRRSLALPISIFAEPAKVLESSHLGGVFAVPRGSVDPWQINPPQ